MRVEGWVFPASYGYLLTWFSRFREIVELQKFVDEVQMNMSNVLSSTYWKGSIDLLFLIMNPTKYTGVAL